MRAPSLRAPSPRLRVPSGLRSLRTQLARPRVILAAKSAVAADLAWLLAPFMPGVTDDYPYYAPLGALVCMYPTVMGSARTALRSLLGLATGIAIAAVAVQFDVPVVWRLPVIIGVSVLVGGLRVFGAGRDWIAMTALFVLVVGGGQAEEYSLGYLSQMALGVAVGLAVNFLVLPPIFVDDAAQESDAFRLRLASHLEELAGVVRGEQSSSGPSWESRGDDLARSLGQLRDSVAASDFSRRGNLRAVRYRERIAAQSSHLRSLERVTFFVRDVTETLAGTSRDEAVPATLEQPVREPVETVLEHLGAALRAWRTPQDEGGALDDARDALEVLRERSAELTGAPSLEAAASVRADLERIIATVEADRDAAPDRVRGSASAGGAGASPELGDDGAVAGAGDGDVGEPGAAVGRADPGVGDEDVPEAGGGDERHVGAGGDGELAPAVAGEGERGVGEGEDVAAVADRVPVDHEVGHGHRDDGVVDGDRRRLHAEGP